MTNKSLEALEELKIYLPAIYSEVAKCLNTIKQDLEAYEQLKQDHDKTLINNGELCVKVCKLEKENQDLKDKLNSEALDNWQLHCKYGKYKKAIDILKEETNLRITTLQGQYLIQQGAGNFEGIYISNEKGKLLKEVLTNEKNT